MTGRKRETFTVWLSNNDVALLRGGGTGRIWVNETYRGRDGKFATLSLTLSRPKKRKQGKKHE